MSQSTLEIIKAMTGKIKAATNAATKAVKKNEKGEDEVVADGEPVKKDEEVPAADTKKDEEKKEEPKAEDKK